MNKKSFVFALLFFSFPLLATIRHLHVDDPLHWQSSALTSYIGDTIILDQPLYNCYYYTTNTYKVAFRRVYIPTNQYLPASSQYTEYMQLNELACLSLNNVKGYHRNGEKIIGLQALVQSESQLSFISGTWSENSRKDLEKGLDMSQVDKKGKHSLLVCAMNLEYYLTNNITNDGYGPSTEEEHQLQRIKISAALATINADIYGLAEVQQGQNALKEIAADLSKKTGRRFSYIGDATSVYGAYTKVGYVYCSDVVSPYGSLQNNDAEVQHRKKIQAFKENSTGEVFLFSMNHFKAKSGTGSGQDADQGDGQGIYNYTRVKEAQSVLSQYNSIRRQSDNDILIMGDLNAYAMEDPITILKDNNMTDLHRYFFADSSYSYTYSGQIGYIDHALCSPSLLPQITGMTVYHINSDENKSFSYKNLKDSTMFRCSDHDPVIVGLKLNKNATTLQNTTNLHFQLSVNDKNITISYNSPSNKIVHCSLYSITGSVISQSPVQLVDGKGCIPKPVIVGVYVLQIQDNNNAHRIKFVVK